MPVSSTASAALADNVLIRHCHIVYDLSACGILYERSRRNGDYGIGSAFSVLFTTRSVITVFRDEFSLIAEREKRICSRVHLEYNISTSAAVAAVGTARINVFFSMEGYGTVPTVACLQVNFDIIYKHSDLLLSGGYCGNLLGSLFITLLPYHELYWSSDEAKGIS